MPDSLKSFTAVLEAQFDEVTDVAQQGESTTDLFTNLRQIAMKDLSYHADSVHSISDEALADIVGTFLQGQATSYRRHRHHDKRVGH